MSSDILIGIGDTAAYTVGVFTVIAVDHHLVQVLPAAFLFMVGLISDRAQAIA